MNNHSAQTKMCQLTLNTEPMLLISLSKILCYVELGKVWNLSHALDMVEMPHQPGA